MKTFQDLWNDDAWRARANDWTRRVLAEKNIALRGELCETQVRLWSIVLNVETDQGKIFFKAAPPDARYEVALTEKLSQWTRQCVPPVLAVEHSQGWWLARDGGEAIRANLKATRDLTEWQQAIDEYAHAQMELAKHVDEMLALGVPDRRPRTIPARYENLLTDTATLRIDLEKGITSDEYARLHEMLPQLQEWCAQLEQGSIPLSLHHGDLNSGNVLRRDAHHGDLNSGNVLKHGTQYKFIDWGDASVAHPFFSIRTPLVSIELVLDLPDYDPFTAPVRDAYLNAWKQYDTRENIFSTFCTAQRVSEIVTALSWYQTVVTAPPDQRADYEHIVPSCLQALLNFDLEKYPFV